MDSSVWGRGRRVLRWILTAASLACATGPVAAQDEPAPRPALWMVRDADTTIYLFGTFHSLDRSTGWFSPQLSWAFARSDELVLETIVPPAPLLRDAARRIAFSDDGRPRPYFERTGAVLGDGRRMGLDAGLGADTALRRLADLSGKPVAGLESFDGQLKTLARIRPEPARAPVFDPPAALTLQALFAAWKSGDATPFAATLDRFRVESPNAYRALFVRRNAHWADWIAHRLKQPGTVFVAVGSGHLTGADSVQQRLAAKGIVTARIG